MEAARVVDVHEINLHQTAAAEGYVLDKHQLAEQLNPGANVNLKTDRKGYVLIPQPSDDPHDPLNWSRWKKAGILFVVIVNSFTSDYSTTTGASAILPQSQQWHISPKTVNHATNGMTFMLGVGGLATVWLSAWIGRLPILFWFSVLAAATAAWAAAAETFDTYMTARILNGTFVAAAVGGGLMWIKDVWFFHEHPRKINLWATAIVLSPYLGPQIMAAIITVSNWRSGMWTCFGIISFGLVCTVVMGDETFYPRHLPPAEIPKRKSRLLSLIGVEQVRTNWTTNNCVEAGSRLGRTLAKLPVLLTCLYYFIDFPWTIGINQTISVFIVPDYHFSYGNLAAMYTAPVVGALLALIFGHFTFDAIGMIYAKYHQGHLEPENRLIMLWLLLPIKIISHNLIGSAIEKHWSYWILAVGWAMHNFAMVLSTASVGAYLIDAYPEASGESCAWLNSSRTLGGFIIGYFQIDWAKTSGTSVEYGIQSAIMGAAFVIVVLLQFRGAQLRRRQGPLKFKTT